MRYLKHNSRMDIHNDHHATKPEPFPIMATISVGIAMFANNIAMSNLFSYVGFMVVHLKVVQTKEESGFYAGFLASSFMVGRTFSAYFWGLAADKYGRKPVLVIGCLSSSFFQIIFGFSNSFSMAILSRLFLGIFNAISGTAKTVASELVPSDQKVRQAKIMSYMSLGVSLANLIGPAFGGWLAEPNKQYPNSDFGNATIFKNFPYLAPNLMAAFLALLSGLMIFCFLPETLKKKMNTSRQKRGSSYVKIELVVQVDDNNDEQVDVNNDLELIEEGEIKAMEGNSSSNNNNIEDDESDNSILLDSTGSNSRPEKKISICCASCNNFHPSVIIACFIYCFHSFNAIALQEIFPLWLLSSKAHGGLDLQASYIGTIISIVGLSLLIFQAFVYPWLAKKYSITQLMKYAMIFLVPSIILMPFVSAFEIEFAIFFCTFLRCLQMCLVMCMFTAIFLAINNASDDENRGAANGLAMLIGSTAKALGPISASVIFAWSITGDNHSFPFAHHFTFFIIAFLTFILYLLLLFVPSAKLNGEEEE